MQPSHGRTKQTPTTLTTSGEASADTGTPAFVSTNPGTLGIGPVGAMGEGAPVVGAGVGANGPEPTTAWSKYTTCYNGSSESTTRRKPTK